MRNTGKIAEDIVRKVYAGRWIDVTHLRRDLDAMLEQLDDWKSYASAAVEEGKMNPSVVPTLSQAIENMTKGRYMLQNAERLIARSPNVIL